MPTAENVRKCRRLIRSRSNLGSDEKEEIDAEVRVPKVFLVFDTPLKLQLRTYIYQARDLPAMDQDGFAGNLKVMNRGPFNEKNTFNRRVGAF